MHIVVLTTLRKSSHQKSDTFAKCQENKERVFIFHEKFFLKIILKTIAYLQ